MKRIEDVVQRMPCAVVGVRLMANRSSGARAGYLWEEMFDHVPMIKDVRSI